MLVTTRERLELPAERVVEVLPLEPAAAVELFVERGRRVRAGYEPGARERADIAALVSTLDHLPLAIVLAAAGLDRRDPAAMQAQAGDRFTMLRRPGSDRHAALDAVLGTSWTALSPAEQVALVRVTCFRGAFSRAAGIMVVGPPAAAASLDALRRKSLLHAVVDATSGHVHVRLLESVRAFASERAAVDPDLSGARQRHAEQVLREARAASSALTGARGLDGLAALGRLLPDLLDLLHTPETPPHRAVAAGCAAVRFLAIRGPHAVLEAALPRLVALRAAVPVGAQVELVVLAVDRLARWGRLDEATTLLDQLPDTDLTPALRGEVAYSRGWVAMQRAATWADAEARFTRARDLAEQLDSDFLYARSTERLGVLRHWRGDAPEAVSLLEDAVATFEVIDTRISLGAAWGNLANAMRVTRALGTEAAFKTALVLAEEAGAVHLSATIRGNLGSHLYEAGRFAEAAERYRAAVDRFSELGDERYRAVMEANLGETEVVLGQPATGRRHLLRAIRRDKKSPYRGMWWGEVARSHLIEGADDQAARALDRCLPIVREIGARGHLATALRLHALLQLLQDRVEDARTAIDEARALCRDQGDRRGVALAECLCAAADQLNHADPLPALQRARRLAEVVGDRALGLRLQLLHTVFDGQLPPDTSGLDRRLIHHLMAHRTA